MEGLITGIGMNDTIPIFELRAADGRKPQIQLEAKLALRIVGRRRCIGYRLPTPGAPLEPCPADERDITGSQCEACVARAAILPCLRCRGDRCRNLLIRPSCVQPANHAVYLAAFSPGVYKVGVARWTRQQERLIEQGARAALIVGRADGLLARRMEDHIRMCGIPDRLDHYSILESLSEPTRSDVLLGELHLQERNLRRRLIDEPWLPTSHAVDLPTPYQLHERPDLLRPQHGFGVAGAIVGVAGQIAFVAREGARIAALPLRDLIGFDIEHNEDPGSYQMTLK